MKNILAIICSLLIVNVAFGQRVYRNDPSYAEGNYKHPNKAAYARKHNLDKSTILETAVVTRNDNYKQPFNKTVRVKKPVMRQERKNEMNRSYKHPYGL